MTDALNSVSALGTIGLALISSQEIATEEQLWVAVALQFVTSWGIALTYYIPSPLFCVKFGRAHTGVVSAYLDVCSASVAGISRLLLAPLIDSAWGWAGFWWVMCGCTVVSTVVTHYFVLDLMVTHQHEGLSGESDGGQKHAGIGAMTRLTSVSTNFGSRQNGIGTTKNPL